mmetsp:Transcript_75986/g.197728  ORF Transcript_75986/g.197728 Transcript_75986/m.197728 type:complete len:219 (-) Transcript_75986:19-675(-)
MHVLLVGIGAVFQKKREDRRWAAQPRRSAKGWFPIVVHEGHLRCLWILRERLPNILLVALDKGTQQRWHGGDPRLARWIFRDRPLAIVVAPPPRRPRRRRWRRRPCRRCPARRLGHRGMVRRRQGTASLFPRVGGGGGGRRRKAQARRRGPLRLSPYRAVSGSLSAKNGRHLLHALTGSGLADVVRRVRAHGARRLETSRRHSKGYGTRLARSPKATN